MNWVLSVLIKTKWVTLTDFDKKIIYKINIITNINRTTNGEETLQINFQSST